MSTEEMNPQVGQQEEPVLVLDDKKYVISELSEEAKYLVACLNSLAGKRQNLQMELDQVAVATEGFTTKLKEVVENPPEEEDTEVVEAE
tara:strand:- start:532 stop:798 length:267 start_codon:yes stop_codon:yes gene_type:complete